MFFSSLCEKNLSQTLSDQTLMMAVVANYILKEVRPESTVIRLRRSRLAITNATFM